MSNTGNIRHVLFIIDRYPTANNSSCIFVKNLITSVADMGILCTVVSPQIITPKIKTMRDSLPYKMTDYTEKGAEITVYSPLYFYASSRPSMLWISMRNHTAAVLRTMRSHSITPDVIYGHFIYQCGLAAAGVGKKLNIPSFLAVGESDKLDKASDRCHGAYQTGLKRYGWKVILNSLTGILCVSEYSKALLIQNGFADKDKFNEIPVFPNGVDAKKFYPYGKKAARKRLGFDENAFIVAFVGAFNENKGATRLSEALDQVGDVKSIFIGKPGPCVPDCTNILFLGQCDNSEVPLYLSAADVFVLPTRSEGCCNAIIEAMACGLPVISSDKPFNDGLLTKENSIRINPDNIAEIAGAILTLKANPELCASMGKASLKIAKNMDVDLRAEHIMKFMEREIKHAQNM